MKYGSLQGADLAHIFTEPAAATVIKSYSPEVLVGKSPVGRPGYGN